MNSGRGKKRSHARYARDDHPSDIGLGATLAHVRNPEPLKTMSNDEPGSGEWQVVSRGKKKQKRTNYPALGYSDLHRLQSSAKLSDLQGLVLYCLADGTSPQWVSIRHHNMVKKAVVLFVPGLEIGMFDGALPMSETPKKQVKTEDQSRKVDGDSNNVHTEGNTGNFQNLANVTSIQSQLGQDAALTPRHASSPDDYLPRKLESMKLPKALKPLENIFEYLWPIRAPGDDRYSKVHSPLQAMLQSPLTKSQDERRIEREFKGPKLATSGKNFESKRTPIPTYISSNEALQENDYVLHPTNLPEEERENELQRRIRNKQASEHGWVDTAVLSFEDGTVPDQDFEHGSLLQGRKILAMDCEMCQVEDGELALTRISLVDWDGATVMDELVKPDLPITDYLTQYSGMTAEKLDPISTTLAQIQQRLLVLLTPQTILVGHSLNSDLSALKITHPFIIDTALLYPHPRGPPLKSSLKWLTQKYLGREIQKGHGSIGHNSVEDAIACLDLVKLKCERGPAWGTNESTNESIFKRLKRASAPGASRGGEEGEGRTGAIVDHGHPERNFGQMANYCIGCNSDSEIVNGVKRSVLGDDDGRYIPGGGVDFTWARLRELEVLRGWRNDDPGATSQQPDPSSENLAFAVAQTVTYIQQIRNFLPPCTLLIVYSGTGDPRDMARLQGIFRQYRKEFLTRKWDELTVKWTDDEDQALKAAIDKARAGLGLVVIT